MRRPKVNCCRLIITTLSILMLSFSAKAQIEPIQVGSTTREMLVYAPSGIETGRPLLLSLHGLNQDIDYQKNQTQWETIAKANDFVVVYPAGINNSWDISGTQDTDFILAIIDEMVKRYGIDRKRVYLSGFSMGGMMTYHAATIIADKIAAFAPVSGYLMQGPNTNSSRPIPIIHTHGTGDDVVQFSGVQACMDAWVARNNCPTTAVVTDPYPADKPSSNGTKYYWGPGTDNVAVVLLKLDGPGHWHSIDPTGVNTSQEIWDFCKQYSLGFGVPEFKFAYVGDEKPGQIQLTLSESIEDSSNYYGFAVKVDSQLVTIDSVVLADTNLFTLYLQDDILKENAISISYTDGNIASIYAKDLENFSDTLVENLLPGSAPRIVEMWVNEGGDTLLGKFNKKMQIPSDLSTLSLRGEYNSDFDIPILGSSYIDIDSTLLAFPLDSQIYADYDLYLTYSGSNIASIDTGYLKTFNDFPVTNNSIGLPVQILSAELSADSYTLFLEFPKPMLLDEEQLDQIILKSGDDTVAFKQYSISADGIRFILSNNLHYGDEATVSYSSGTITAADGGALEEFSNVEVEVLIEAPTWHEVPGKVEAEDYTFQFGTSTETTSDAGGGLNVGWIETGDWLEYAIDNITSETEYQITFRTSTTNSTRRIYLYLDNERIATVPVTNTGDWQTWSSSTVDISIAPGKHYIKLVAANDGFNVNYFDVHVPSAIEALNDDRVTIGPNPATDNVVIWSTDFKYTNIEIIDVMGRTVLQKSVTYEPEFRMPVNLSDGAYFIKLSNEKQFVLKKISIQNP